MYLFFLLIYFPLHLSELLLNRLFIQTLITTTLFHNFFLYKLNLFIEILFSILFLHKVTLLFIESKNIKKKRYDNFLLGLSSSFLAISSISSLIFPILSYCFSNFIVFSSYFSNNLFIWSGFYCWFCYRLNLRNFYLFLIASASYFSIFFISFL